MARVELRRDLNAVMARQAAATVARLAADVERIARDRAPDAKIWLSMDDARVRPAHVEAHGQTIPANLRYELTRQEYVHGGGRGSDVPGHTVLLPNLPPLLARKPRDRDLPPDQTANCRCQSMPAPGLIARRIETSPVTVTATAARARVQVRFTRIAESEFGTPGDRAAHFMTRAVQQVAARLNARARRT